MFQHRFLAALPLAVFGPPPVVTVMCATPVIAAGGRIDGDGGVVVDLYPRAFGGTELASYGPPGPTLLPALARLELSRVNGAEARAPPSRRNRPKGRGFLLWSQRAVPD